MKYYKNKMSMVLKTGFALQIIGFVSIFFFFEVKSDLFIRKEIHPLSC